MVYAGRSRGCATCRRRKIKCDESKPECENCRKKQQTCPGYKHDFDINLKDETSVVMQQGRRRAPNKSKGRDESSASLVPATLPRDAETTALCFFFGSYVLIGGDPASPRGMFDLLLPVYSRVNHDSPLSFATSAVSIAMWAVWTGRGIETNLCRRFLGKALASISVSLGDPVESMKDETFLTVLLLQYLDNMSAVVRRKSASSNHQNGAVALIKYRGRANFTSSVSIDLLQTVRSSVVASAITKHEGVSADPDLWTDMERVAIKPGPELDKLGVGVANLRAKFETWRATRPCWPNSRKNLTQEEQLLPCDIWSHALELNARLREWTKTLPEYWHPLGVSGPASIDPSIASAGLFDSFCEVYTSMQSASIWNTYRIYRIIVLMIILHLQNVPTGPPNHDIVFENIDIPARETIRQLIDGLCASVPYHLGNRAKPAGLEESHDVMFPSYPPKEADSDEKSLQARYSYQLSNNEHLRFRIATGGYHIIQALRLVLEIISTDDTGIIRSLLREGQLKWLQGQMMRVIRIHRLDEYAAASAPTRE